ncbi:MAG: hypothetical protein M3336_10400 [Chloroflexota bacterium]|nr:hypothetical protein [Chloroflexota bacterium]
MDEHEEHAEHSHLHGPTCGHTSETHEGHTDYVHDGHRHRAHEQHWDECAIRSMPAGDQIAPHEDMTRPEELRTSTGP